METQSDWQEAFEFFAQMPIVVEQVDAHLSTDAGLLAIRQLDDALGLTEQFAAALIDPRTGNALTHSYLEITRSRIYDDLASQPTLSRFENAIGPKSLFRLQDVRIVIRADSGFGVPGFYEACERLRLDFTIGLRINAVLKRESDDLFPTLRNARGHPESHAPTRHTRWGKGGLLPCTRPICFQRRLAPPKCP